LWSGKRPINEVTPPTKDLNKNLWETFNYGSFNRATSPTKKQREFLHVLSTESPPKETMDPEWKQLTDDEIERGIKVLETYVTDDRKAKMDRVLSQRTSAARIVFENPSNANNAWAALRSMDSFGIQYCDIITDSTVYVNKHRRGTMHQALGSQKWMSLKQHSSTQKCLDGLIKDGYRIAVTDIHHPKSIPMNQVKWNEQKTAIVLGNELKGISDIARDRADIHFYLPLKGFAESLNVSAFCACLCENLEQSGILDPGHPLGVIPDQDKSRIYLTWLARTAPGAIPLLKREGLDIQCERLYETIAGFTTKPI
jgi:tRNA G18 (ribose-2'-O)-methylase SpoU